MTADIELGTEPDPVAALRDFAAVCTEVADDRGLYEGLELFSVEPAQDETPQQLADRLVRASKFDAINSFVVECRIGPDGTMLDPPRLTITPGDPAKLVDYATHFFARFDEPAKPPYLEDHQRRFLADQLPGCLARLVDGAVVHEIVSNRNWSCCGSSQFLIERPEQWVAVQIYCYC